MARIVVVTHEFDQFAWRGRFWKPFDGYYLLLSVMKALQARGHRWGFVAGPRYRAGDAAILHVDSTKVDPEYLALATRYPVSLNFGAADISKRHVSRTLLSRHDKWDGPVIMKSDLNCMGVPEAMHNERAAKAGSPLPHPALKTTDDYTILPSMAEVPDDAWDDASRIVERFIPEPDEQGYAVRSWVFLGERERCSRHVAPSPVVKATNSISRTEAAIPEALRAERARLGIDYGKFDFVEHDGVPTLLDANKTPGRPSGTEAALIARAAFLADGFEALLKRR